MSGDALNKKPFQVTCMSIFNPLPSFGPAIGHLIEALGRPMKCREQ